jgi:hypothetical protein
VNTAIIAGDKSNATKVSKTIFFILHVRMQIIFLIGARENLHFMQKSTNCIVSVLSEYNIFGEIFYHKILFMVNSSIIYAKVLQYDLSIKQVHASNLKACLNLTPGGA